MNVRVTLIFATRTFDRGQCVWASICYGEIRRSFIVMICHRYGRFYMDLCYLRIMTIKEECKGIINMYSNKVVVLVVVLCALVRLVHLEYPQLMMLITTITITRCCCWIRILRLRTVLTKTAFSAMASACRIQQRVWINWKAVWSHGWTDLVYSLICQYPNLLLLLRIHGRSQTSMN